MPCALYFYVDGYGGPHAASFCGFDFRQPDANADEPLPVILVSASSPAQHNTVYDAAADDARPDQDSVVANLVIEPVGFVTKPLKNTFDHPEKLPWSVQIATDFPTFNTSEHITSLVDHVRLGLHANYSPQLAPEGSGGVYFMRNESGVQNIAVFKPADEEPMAINNPKGYTSLYMGNQGLRRGTKAGLGAFREVAAYILDHPSTVNESCRSENGHKQGFAGVPPTVLVRCCHEVFSYNHAEFDTRLWGKLGSLQQFVHASVSCDDMEAAHFPVEEVHKITVLDLRLANTDRHDENILLCREKEGLWKLVPVDHGYCLPETFEDCLFEWLYWPQASQPYGDSALKYIEALDAEADIELLQHCNLFLEPAYQFVLRVATMVLKKGAAAGLSPFQIGCILSCGKPTDIKPPIKILLEKVEALGCSSSIHLQTLLERLSVLLDDYITKVKDTVDA